MNHPAIEYTRIAAAAIDFPQHSTALPRLSAYSIAANLARLYLDFGRQRGKPVQDVKSRIEIANQKQEEVVLSS